MITKRAFPVYSDGVCGRKKRRGGNRMDHVCVALLLLSGDGADDIRVSGVGDGQGGDGEVLSAGSSKLDVVARVVVDTSVGEHSVVLELRLAKRGAVLGNDDELGFTVAEGLEGLLVSQEGLTALHDESETRVNSFLRLFLLVGNHFVESWGR